MSFKGFLSCCYCFTVGWSILCDPNPPWSFPFFIEKRYDNKHSTNIPHHTVHNQKCCAISISVSVASYPSILCYDIQIFLPPLLIIKFLPWESFRLWWRVVIIWAPLIGNWGVVYYKKIFCLPSYPITGATCTCSCTCTVSVTTNNDKQKQEHKQKRWHHIIICTLLN